MPVDLYGQMADRDALIPMAQRHGLELIWDAIESHTKNGDLFIRFVLKRNEVGYLRDTSGAPCRPEIEHYDLSAKL